MQYRTSSMAEDVFETYYFEKNLQGDIIAVYNASGTKLVSYTYDAWGNCTTTYYNGGGSTGAQYNPFRYRGYYYDSDLGLYYLNSRYYDSNTGRFINADGYASTGQGLLGNNMYVYCGNNPIIRNDKSGMCWDCFCSFGERFWELSLNYDGTHSLYDNMRFENVDSLLSKGGFIFHEQILVASVDNEKNALSGSYGDVSSPNISFGGEVLLVTGGWEGSNWDLSLLDFGVASIEASVGADSIGYSANLCIWRPTFTLEGDFFDFSVSLNCGISSENYISNNEGKATVGILTFGIKLK